MESRMRGTISLLALVVLSSLALILALTLSWAMESRAEGNFLSDLQRVISSLDLGIEEARAGFPEPAFFDFSMEGIRIYSGAFTPSVTNQITEDVPSLIQFSYEEVKAVVMETSVTAESKISNRGIIRRSKSILSTVLVPR